MNFNDMKNVLLQNPEVLKEYNNLKPEYDKIYTNLSEISKDEFAIKTKLDFYEHS